MNAERLAEIEARLRAATPGPWRAKLARTKLYISSDLQPVVELSVAPPRVFEREVRDERTRRVRADADLIAHAPADLADLLAEVRHLQLCLDIMSQPGSAGPPSNNPDDINSDNAAIRLRAGYLRVAIWTFAAMAAQYPAPNYLAFTYGPLPSAPPDMDPMPVDLAGYRLEVAAVKPGGVGPLKLVDELKAKLAAYTDLPPEPDTAMGAFMAVLMVDNDAGVHGADGRDCDAVTS